MPTTIKDAPGAAPHGGGLELRAVGREEKDELAASARRLPQISTEARRVLSDLELLAVGAVSPNRGFMGRGDYGSVVDEMRLLSGVPWSIPLTLAVTDEEAGRLEPGKPAAVSYRGRPVAIIDVEDVYGYDREHEAERIYQTTDPSHPGVAHVYSQGPHYVGGEVSVLESVFADEFSGYRLTPLQLRESIAARGWRTAVAFQTRNPIHRAHEYLTKCALETVDGLVIHPLVGGTKGDDISAETRMKCYEALIDNYYPRGRVILSVFPAAMRYAGPREAIWHALLRKNYGITHFIVGRDHAGVGDYYGTYDAQRIFDSFGPDELGISPMKFEHAFFCRRCEGMASGKTCPHGQEHRVHLSGTQVRNLLAEGRELPHEFSRPEVARILVEEAAARGGEGT